VKKEEQIIGIFKQPDGRFATTSVRPPGEARGEFDHVLNTSAVEVIIRDPALTVAELREALKVVRRDIGRFGAAGAVAIKVLYEGASKVREH